MFEVFFYSAESPSSLVSEIINGQIEIPRLTNF